MLTATPGTTDVNLAQNQTVNLAPGVYRDLIVAKKGTVNFTGGVYVFRSVTIQREANLFFAAPSTVKVEGKMSTATLTKIQPGPGSTATAATIVWHIAGMNGTNGALASTPKPLEIATDNVLQANFYVPNRHPLAAGPHRGDRLLHRQKRADRPRRPGRPGQRLVVPDAPPSDTVRPAGRPPPPRQRGRTQWPSSLICRGQAASKRAMPRASPGEGRGPVPSPVPEFAAGSTKPLSRGSEAARSRSSGAISMAAASFSRAAFSSFLA